MPYKLSLSVTNKCNCRCLICQVWRVYCDSPRLESEELGAEEWEKFFIKNGNSFFWVAITGGEPFLKKDISEIVAACIRYCPDLLLLSIVTNGFSTELILKKTEEILNICKDIKLYIVVSVDGEKEIHEKLRRSSGGYEQVLKTISLLDKLSEKYKNLKVRLETIISRNNLGYTSNFIDSKLVNAHSTSFAFAQESERYFNRGTEVSLKGMEWEILSPVISKLAKKTGFFSLEQLILKMYYKLSRLFFLKSDKQVIPCAASTASIFIGSYGEVRPCIMMDSAGKLADCDFDLKKIMRSRKMIELKQNIVKNNCPNCWTPCEAMQSIIQNFSKAIYLCLTIKRGD